MRQRKTPPEQAPGAFLYGVPTGNDISQHLFPPLLTPCKYLHELVNFLSKFGHLRERIFYTRNQPFLKLLVRITTRLRSNSPPVESPIRGRGNQSALRSQNYSQSPARRMPVAQHAVVQRDGKRPAGLSANRRSAPENR